MLYPQRLPAGFDEQHPPSAYSGHYRINSCNGCGLIYSSPIMGRPAITALYQKGTETNAPPAEEDNVRRTMQGYYDLAKPFLIGRTRMMDVGCDMGFMLDIARADSFHDVVGLEPVPSSRDHARRIPNAQIFDKFIEDTDFPADHFDLVVMIHVLDHLDDPRSALQRVRANLRPGGIVLAVVHNVRSLLYFVLRERFPIFNMYHHYFFSKKTLARLFRSQGYEVLKVVGTYNCYSLGFLVRQLSFFPNVVRKTLLRILETFRLSKIPVTIRLGNIGIIARRPIGADKELTG